jgi:hypothetical protein
MHAVYDKLMYSNAINVDTIQIGDEVYYGFFSRSDIDRLNAVFRALKITDVTYYNKMDLYKTFIEKNQCIVDVHGNSIIILVKQDNLCYLGYSKTLNFDQRLLQICSKYGVKDIVDFSTFVDYDCICKFNNFAKVNVLTGYTTLSIFGFFRYSNRCLPIQCNNFYDESSAKEWFVNNEPTDNKHGENKIESSKEKRPKKEDSVKQEQHIKVKQHHDLVTFICTSLGILIVLVVLLAVIACNLLGSNNESLENDLLVLNDKNSCYVHKLDYVMRDSEISYTEIYDLLQNGLPDGILVYSCEITDSINLTMLVPDDVESSTLGSALPEGLSMQSATEIGLVTQGDVVYVKYLISCSK